MKRYVLYTHHWLNAPIRLRFFFRLLFFAWLLFEFVVEQLSWQRKWIMLRLRLDFDVQYDKNCLCQQFMPWIINTIKWTCSQHGTSVLFGFFFQISRSCFVRWNMIHTETRTHTEWTAIEKLNQSYHFCSFSRPLAIWLMSLAQFFLSFQFWNFLAANAIKLQNVCKCVHVFFSVLKFVFMAAVTIAVPKVKTNTPTRTTIMY